MSSEDAGKTKGVRTPFLDVGAPVAADAVTLRRVRTLNALYLFLLGLTPLYLVQYLNAGVYVPAILITVFTVVGGLAWVWFRLTGAFLFAAHVAPGGFLAAVVTVSTTTGGFSDPSFSWLYIPPLMAGLLAGWRAALLWGTFTLAAMLAFWGIENIWGYQFLNIVLPQDRALVNLEDRVLALAAMLGVVWAYLSNLSFMQAQVMASNTSLRSEVQERRAAQAVEKEASEAKSRFLATMSHEMRTPLHAIIGFSELLLRDNCSLEHQETLATVKASGEALLDQINEVLDFSRTQNRDLVLEKEVVNLRHIVEGVVATVRPTLDAHSTVLDLKFETGVPAYIFGDQVRLRQVFANLISNAAKFTEDGAVQVDLRCQQMGEKSWLVATVADSGIGISEQQLPRIFEPFRQAEASIARQYGGTGLGLSIARSLAQAMGGTLEAVSAPGKGSTFSFRIPIEPAAEPSLDVGFVSTEERLPSMRTLVVDDQAVNRVVLGQMLRALGVAFEEASSGGNAVEALASGNFDLIWMDCRMPKQDGYETAQAIRAGAHSDVVIVAVTADTAAGSAEQAREAGMDDILIKPLHLEDVKRTLWRWSKGRMHPLSES